MQGCHKFQPELFAQIDYEALIPANHLVRRIDKILDLSFVRKLTKRFYSKSQGRPSIDPEVFFRICILGHIYGIKSDRRLCDEIQFNLAYRWFVRFNMGDAVPDHSSLTRVRDRLGVSCFQEVFEKVVEQCVVAGLVSGKCLITDATLIEANTSVSRMVERSELGEIKHEKNPGSECASKVKAEPKEPVPKRTHVSQVVERSELSEIKHEKKPGSECASKMKAEPKEPVPNRKPVSQVVERSELGELKHEKNPGSECASKMKAEPKEPVPNRKPVSQVVERSELGELKHEKNPGSECASEVKAEPKEPVPKHKPVSKKKPVSNRTHVSQVEHRSVVINIKGR